MREEESSLGAFFHVACPFPSPSFLFPSRPKKKKPKTHLFSLEHKVCYNLQLHPLACPSYTFISHSKIPIFLSVHSHFHCFMHLFMLLTHLKNLVLLLHHPTDVHTCMLSCFSHVWLFAILWTIACQAPLSMGFAKQEYWSGLPCPLPGDLLDPGIEPASPVFPDIAGGFFTPEPPEKPTQLTISYKLNCWKGLLIPQDQIRSCLNYTAFFIAFYWVSTMC